MECVSVEGTARLADPVHDSEAIEVAVSGYVAKYWADTAVHQEMGDFVRGNAIFEVTPERAFGIIEREEEFGARATRWRW